MHKIKHIINSNKMLSGYDDAYRTYSNNMSTPWVVDGKVKLDPMIEKWIKDTKVYSDNGYNNKTSLWDATWTANQGPEGKVFGYFYSTWGINFTLKDNSLAKSTKEGGKYEVGNGNYGKYRVFRGPANYYWGGTWICAAKGTDNITQIKDIMEKLTCDKDIAEKITRGTEDYTNNKAAMHKLATDKDYHSDFLGGQNHIALFEKTAAEISMKNMSAYDQGCNEQIQKAMKDYFAGEVTLEKAVANFKTKLTNLYPKLEFDAAWDNLK